MAVSACVRFGTKFVQKLPSAGLKLSRSFSSSGTAWQKWDLACAVCLERKPILSAELNDMEQKFTEFQRKVEFEHSLLSEHELRHRDDLMLMERRKDEDYEETEAEAIRQTALEAEDAWESNANEFTPASRRTADDISKNEKSYNRQLDRKLVLLVKQKLGRKENWIMPTGLRQDGESMREAAERILEEICGGQINTSFKGNMPCSVHKLKYSPFTEGNGAKVFFFKANIDGGSVEETDHTSDYKWVPKEELGKYLNDSYKRTVDRFVIDI